VALDPTGLGVDGFLRFDAFMSFFDSLALCWRLLLSFYVSLNVVHLATSGEDTSKVLNGNFMKVGEECSAFRASESQSFKNILR